MPKYILTSAIGGTAVGSQIELTDEQAQHPLYRHRVRKMDIQSEASLEVATPEPKKRGPKPKQEAEQQEQIEAGEE